MTAVRYTDLPAAARRRVDAATGTPAEATRRKPRKEPEDTTPYTCAHGDHATYKAWERHADETGCAWGEIKGLEREPVSGEGGRR